MKQVVSVVECSVYVLFINKSVDVSCASYTSARLHYRPT